MAKKTVILIVFLIVVLVVLLFLAFSNKKSIQNVTAPKTPTTVIPDTHIKKATKISAIIPGKTSDKEVKKIMGAPASETQEENNLRLNYNASFKNFSDEVVIKNDLVYYSVENVFDDNQYGTAQTFLTTYGNPSLTLFQKDNIFTWDIFLKAGVGIETNGTEILKIIRFLPQDKVSFINTIGKELLLSETASFSNEDTNLAP